MEQVTQIDMQRMSVVRDLFNTKLSSLHNVRFKIRFENDEVNLIMVSNKTGQRLPVFTKAELKLVFSGKIEFNELIEKINSIEFVINDVIKSPK